MNPNMTRKQKNYVNRPRGCRGKKSKNKKKSESTYMTRGNNLNVGLVGDRSTKSLMNITSAKCSFCKRQGVALWWIEKYFLSTIGRDPWWIIQQFLGLNKKILEHRQFDYRGTIRQHMPYFGFVSFNKDKGCMGLAYIGKMSYLNDLGKIQTSRRNHIFRCQDNQCIESFIRRKNFQRSIVDLYHTFKRYCLLKRIDRKWKKTIHRKANHTMVDAHKKLGNRQYLISDCKIAVHENDANSLTRKHWKNDIPTRFSTRNEAKLNELYRHDGETIHILLEGYVNHYGIKTMIKNYDTKLKHFIYYHVNNIICANSVHMSNIYVPDDYNHFHVYDPNPISAITYNPEIHTYVDPKSKVDRERDEDEEFNRQEERFQRSIDAHFG
jgi:hypothetical protein